MLPFECGKHAYIICFARAFSSWELITCIRSTSLSVRVVFLRLLMPDSPCAAHLRSATLRQMIVHQYCFFLAISDTFLSFFIRPYVESIIVITICFVAVFQ